MTSFPVGIGIIEQVRGDKIIRSTEIRLDSYGSQILGNFRWIDSLETYPPDVLEQRILFRPFDVVHPARFKEVVDLRGRQSPLQFLTVEKLCFEFLERLLGFHHLDGHLSVSTSHTRRHDIGHPATFLEESGRFASREELETEVVNLHDSNAHYCRFGVIAPTKPIYKASSHGYDIFERAAERYSLHIFDDLDSECRCLKK